jgi:hypothetical protein
MGATKLLTAGGGGVTLDAASTATDKTITVPADNGTLVYANSSGDVGIGTSSPETTLEINSGTFNAPLGLTSTDTACYVAFRDDTTTGGLGSVTVGVGAIGNNLILRAGAEEQARINSDGDLLVGKTSANRGVAGFEALGNGVVQVTTDGTTVMNINRNTSDGFLIGFYQANTLEGSISVSGTTVSYNGGHLSRWAQTTTAKDESLVKGTVLSNLDEMNVYTDEEGNTVENEQLNKVKVSDVEGDANVAGVFVNWSYDEAHNVDEINMAMTGDMIIRIAQGVTVARGDLLMSAGDGTAKPQGDDIVRAKTIAKVTSTHITCTYEDGSYCVPCVLMAC